MSKKYFIIPVIYALVVVLLFVLQFTGKEKFTDSVGDLTITGITSSKGHGKEAKISKINLEYNCLSLSFSRDRGVDIETADGRKSTANIRSYTLFPDGAELDFSDDFGLRFIIAGGIGKQLRIVPFFNNSNEEVRSLSVPYSVCEGGGFLHNTKLPIATVRKGEESYFLSMPQGSRIDTKNARLTLVSENGALGAITLEKPEHPNTDPITYWFSKTKNFIGSGEFSSAVDAYLAKAYRGWSETRFNGSRGVWRISPDEERFSESIYLALYSEALKRGDSEVLRNVQRAGRTHADLFTFASSAFNGNVTEAFSRFQEQDKKTWAHITGLVRQQDTTVFATPHLVQFVLDRGPYSLLQEIFSLAESVDLAKADTGTRLGLLRLFLDAKSFLPQIPQSITGLEKIPEDYILPEVFKHKAGLFFQDKEGNLDLPLTVQAGILLRRKGMLDKKDVLVKIGQEMIVSALQYADDEGFLPDLVTLRNGNLETEGDGKIAPESLYPSLPLQERYYPHFRSLYNDYGPGTWIHTASEIDKVTATGKELSLEFSFPEGQIHNIIIQGIDKFTTLTMFDLNWRSDPYFQNYSSGWLYNEETRTLFIKFRNKQKREKITILF